MAPKRKPDAVAGTEAQIKGAGLAANRAACIVHINAFYQLREAAFDIKIKKIKSATAGS